MKNDGNREGGIIVRRLIDANELVSKINKLEVFYFTGETDIAVHDCQMVELGAVLAEIDEAPTVDAVEVKHGRWENNHCTVCGITPLGEEIWEHLDIDPPRFELCMGFCPCCGAKMDGDGNG